MPLIFILLNEKTQEQYENAFIKLRSFEVFFPEMIITDFERGLINALNVFGTQVKRFGCIFHYGQSLWRKIQNIGMSEEYKNNPIFNRIMKFFLNLPYINPNKIQQAYNYIMRQVYRANYTNNLNDFIIYFNRTYFNLTETSPLFEVGFWSCFERVKSQHPRTINAAEGWHKGLNYSVGIRHPNLGRFIEVLRQETQIVRSNISRYVIGEFDVRREDFMGRKNLEILIESEELMTISSIFDCLDIINGWVFD